MQTAAKPLVENKDLVIQEIDSETLVYDLKVSRAYYRHDIRTIIVRLIIIIAAWSMSPERLFSQEKEDVNLMPRWLKNHMDYMTRGTGQWIADNSKFKTKNEPFDEYGIIWKWGIGKKSMRGRLYGLRNRKEIASFWEFHLFWHPTKRKAILQQFGGNGILGVGEIQNVNSTRRIERKSEMTFHSLTGKTWKDRHRIFEDKDAHETTSYSFKNNSWVQRRNYKWRREPKK